MSNQSMSRAIGALVLAAAMAGCTGSAVEQVPIGTPPAVLKLDPFYARSLYAGGIPVTSSARVSDAALWAARSVVSDMLEYRPDLAAAMAAQGYRVVVMATDEGTVDLPEQRDWKKPAKDDPRLTYCERKHYDVRIGAMSDRDYWNSRARGMGGSLTSGAEENILGVPDTRYFGENILVHEFSHAILTALEDSDPAFLAELTRAYDAAVARGLWKGEYGETTVHEYWAEGTQFWFESNKLAVVDGVRILSARDLKRRDPALAGLLQRVYGDRHRLRGDPFWRHPARVPPGPPPRNTAEVC